MFLVVSSFVASGIGFIIVCGWCAYAIYVDKYLLILIFSETERSQIAYVTFRDPQGAETAVLLSVHSHLNTLQLASPFVLP